MKPALFISDLHLAPPRPAVATAFHAWARGPARDACAVYVLGDLFDEWIGDEQADDPFTREVVASLRGIADAGVPVAVMHGNRDFLLGERFARAAGARLLPERIVVDAGGVPTLLMHGDELCTDDADYQRYRAWIRDPHRQRRILALPWAVRRAFSAWLRRRSRNANRTKRDEIMDVNASAVAQALRDAGVARLVHGHTHRPATHALDVDGRRCERHVLPDWHDRAVWLEVDPSGARRRELAP
ncbi:MAG: UDP-2,3-diacylglucosamine diphosphatase [Burkholderiales bacterium]|nr:UDP-2,3-diacylglucosamine diphosphatase [Burkholderiales bacterium]